MPPHFDASHHRWTTEYLCKKCKNVKCIYLVVTSSQRTISIRYLDSLPAPPRSRQSCRHGSLVRKPWGHLKFGSADSYQLFCEFVEQCQSRVLPPAWVQPESWYTFWSCICSRRLYGGCSFFCRLVWRGYTGWQPLVSHTFERVVCSGWFQSTYRWPSWHVFAFWVPGTYDWICSNIRLHTPLVTGRGRNRWFLLLVFRWCWRLSLFSGSSFVLNHRRAASRRPSTSSFQVHSCRRRLLREWCRQRTGRFCTLGNASYNVFRSTDISVEV